MFFTPSTANADNQSSIFFWKMFQLPFANITTEWCHLSAITQSATPNIQFPINFDYWQAVLLQGTKLPCPCLTGKWICFCCKIYHKWPIGKTTGGHYRNTTKKKHFLLLGAWLDTYITNILYIITNIYIQCTKSKATQFIYRLKLG